MTQVADTYMRTNRRRCAVVVLLLELWIAFSVVSVASSVGRLSLFDRLDRSCLFGLDRTCTVPEGRAIDAAVRASDRQQLVLIIVAVSMLVITAIAWTMWQSRAHRILRDKLSVPNLDFTPGWGVGCWFVPFVNLGVPYRAISELWRASDADRPGLIWHADPAPWRIRLWWTGWLATYFLGRLLLITSDEPSAGSLGGGLRTDTVLNIAVDLGTIVTAVLAVSVVIGIQRRQENALAAMLRRLEDTPARPDQIPSVMTFPTAPGAPPQAWPAPSDASASMSGSANAPGSPSRAGGGFRYTAIGAAVAGVVGMALVIGASPRVPSSALDASPAIATPTYAIQPLASGWQLYDDPADGFAIGLPGAWRTEATDDAETKFFATGRGIGPGAGILVASVSTYFVGDLTLETVSQENLRQIRSTPGITGDVSIIGATTPAGSAERIDYQLADGPAQVTQYILVHDEVAFVLTFAAAVDQGRDAEPTFDQIVRTFRFSG
jgi:hypothetical protein